MVVIDSGPLEASQRFRDVPKTKWRALTDLKRYFLSRRLGYDCRCLIEFCEEADVAWQELGYKSAADMIRNGYKLDPVEIELAVVWLKHNEPKLAISLPDVSAKVAAARANPLAEHKRPTSEEQANKGTISTFSRGGNTDYTLRRLARDGRDDLLDAVERGELSVNQAAIKAGYRKKPTPLDVLKRAWGKASDAEREEFDDWLQSELSRIP